MDNKFTPQDIEEIKKIITKQFFPLYSPNNSSVPSLEDLANKFINEMGWRNYSTKTSKVIFSFLYSCATYCDPNFIVLDISAGQCRYKPFFKHTQYVAIDSTVGDIQWDYSKLDIIGDVLQLPIKNESIDICLNFTSLEHYPEPHKAFKEMYRVLKPGGKIFLYAPLTYIEHQIPHDYFRFTRYGLSYLCKQAGLRVESIIPTCGMYETVLELLIRAVGDIKVEEVKDPMFTVIRKTIEPLFLYIEEAEQDSIYDEFLFAQLPSSYCLTALRSGALINSNAHETRQDLIHAIAACPDCHIDLEWKPSFANCPACKAIYMNEKEIPKLQSPNKIW